MNSFLDSTELNISWNNGKGKMIIRLEYFLREQSLSKIRKLIRIIKESDTPEELEKFYEVLKNDAISDKDFANNIVSSREKIKDYENSIIVEQRCMDLFKTERDKYKRKSDSYEYFANLYKGSKERLSQFKRSKKDREQFIKMITRERDFINKCLECIGGEADGTI